MADVHITEFTDPGCPWAFSAEPFRRRLDWLYGETVEWEPRMVVLAETPEEYEQRGMTPEVFAEHAAAIAADHGMPIDTRERARMYATEPACRAFVAARMNAPERARQLLRCLRVHFFSGELLDDPETIAAAARDAELDPEELARWMEQEPVKASLAADKAAARAPLPAAQTLDEKLAGWSGGRRYTCPSYEIERRSDGVRIAVPGFQPFPVYDIAIANLMPEIPRREPAPEVDEVLEWARTPLATKEVAVLCDITMAEARERLGRVADERHVGSDGFWKLK